MPPPKKASNIYKNCTDESLVWTRQLLLSKVAVCLIERPATHSKYPKTTVLNRVNGDVIDSGNGIKAGRRPALPMEVEQKIVDSSLKAAEMCFGISK